MTPTAVAPSLSEEQLAEILDLLGKTDTVELKLTVDEAQQRSAAAALGMDPLEAQIRQAFFFDTPDLKLYDAGVVVRARRVQRKGDDSVVKLRPVVPDELPSELRATSDFGVEVDAMPGGFVCSGSMKHAMKKPHVRDVLLQGGSLEKLFSKNQRALFTERAPDGIELDDLTVLGPIFVLKLKYSPEGYEHKLVAELWLYPDGSRVLELSTKCARDEAFQVAAETRGFLVSHGVSVDAEQQTKTRKALDFFSAELLEPAS